MVTGLILVPTSEPQLIYPFMPSGLFYTYKLDEFICHFWVYVLFYYNHFAEHAVVSILQSVDPDQMPHNDYYVMSDLGLPVSPLWSARHKWVNMLGKNFSRCHYEIFSFF